MRLSKREREEVEMDKEMKKGEKDIDLGGKETDKLETSKKKKRQEIYRLGVEIACGPC